MTKTQQRVRRALVLAGAGAALAAPFGAVHAQAFPSKPITLIVPWPAGGSTGSFRSRSSTARASRRPSGATGTSSSPAWVSSGPSSASCL